MRQKSHLDVFERRDYIHCIRMARLFFPLLLVPFLQYANPASRDGESTLSSAYEKVSLTIQHPQFGKALNKVNSWDEAKMAIIDLWKQYLSALPLTKEHADFAHRNGLKIEFTKALNGKLGTYSRQSGSMEFDETMFEERWIVLTKRRDQLPFNLRDAQYAALDYQSATQLIAMETFPAFVHVLRDQMMYTDLVAHGFFYTGGWLEDEVIHHKEEARVIQEIERFLPSTAKDLPGGAFQFDNGMIVHAAQQGNANLAQYVRSLYHDIPALFYPHKAKYSEDNDLTLWIKKHEEEVESLETKLNECQRTGKYWTETTLGCPPEEDPVKRHERPSLFDRPKTCKRQFTCDLGWRDSIPSDIAADRKRIAYLRNDEELNRLRGYYRPLLQRFDIQPEELK